MMSWAFYFYWLPSMLPSQRAPSHPTGDRMWPHETMSGQLCGDTRIVCTSLAVTLSVLMWIYVYQHRNWYMIQHWLSLVGSTVCFNYIPHCDVFTFFHSLWWGVMTIASRRFAVEVALLGVKITWFMLYSRSAISVNHLSTFSSKKYQTSSFPASQLWGFAVFHHLMW